MVASYLELLAARQMGGGRGERKRGIPQILQVAESAGLAPPIPTMQAPAAAQAQAPDMGGAMSGAMASAGDAMRAAGDMRLKTQAIDDAKAKEAKAQAEQERQSQAAQEALLEAHARGEVPEEQLVRLGLLPPSERGAFASKVLDPTRGIDPLEQAKLDEEIAARNAADQQARDQLAYDREVGLGGLALDQDAEVRQKEDMLADNAQAAEQLAFEREAAAAEQAAPQVLSEGQGLIDPRTGEMIAGIEKAPEPAETPDDIAMMEALGFDLTPEGFQAYQAAGGRPGSGPLRETTAEKISAKNTEERKMAIPDEMSAIQGQLDNAKRLTEINSTAASGMTAGLQAGADKALGVIGLGVPGVDAADTEEMDARFAQSTLDAASQLKGTISDKDMAFLQQAAGDSSMTEEGRRRVIDIMERGFAKKMRMLEAEQAALDQGLPASEAKRKSIDAIATPLDQMSPEELAAAYAEAQ